MEQLMCKYWWKSSSKNSKGIHWKSWSKLTTHKSKGGMGFRNLREFNLCLLSKQGWRLQCNPESLVARIFKARYYASGDYLNAELGSNPSFVWRSVFEAQQVVKLGARKRIGFGAETSILKEPWLPCDDNPWVTSIHPTLINKKVSSLMVTDNLTWDVDLVRDLFNERDAELILSITLNSSRTLDNWFWSFEKSGYFSVKSAYRHLQQSKEDGAGLVSSALWQKLWKLRVPPKVKDLLWRAASNCLPTKTQLRSRYVNVDAICPLCQSCRETIPHCMVECSFARSCWYQLDAGLNTNVTGTFASWLEDKLKVFEAGKRQSLAMVCWALWKVRNDLVWNNKGPKVDAVMALAYTSLDHWQRAQDKNRVPTAAFLTEADGGEKWSKPEVNVIKINVDAATFTEAGTYSFSCVARDHSGSVLEAITSCREGAVTPELAEALGVREALSWIKRKQWHSVVVETDSLIVVQSIRSALTMISYFGNIVNDCKELLVELADVSLLFIRRSASSVAHFLARASYYIADRIIRSVDISPDFHDVIVNDCLL